MSMRATQLTVEEAEASCELASSLDDIFHGHSIGVIAAAIGATMAGSTMDTSTLRDCLIDITAIVMSHRLQTPVSTSIN